MPTESTNGDIIIDPEFAALIPPATDEERAGLEASLRAEGCRDPLVRWRGTRILLDGHTRYPFCIKNGIGFRTVDRDFADRDAAKLWVLRNQLARRNLNDFQRVDLALMLKPLLEAEAVMRERAGRKIDPAHNLAQGQTRDAIAESAGVSHGQVQKVERIKRDAIEPLERMARNGDVSVGAASAVATLPKKTQLKIAAGGPKAVKAKAKELRDEKPQPAVTATADEPWLDFAAGIEGVISEIRGLSRRLGTILEYDADAKNLKSRWAHFYSYSGTVGQLNAIARSLADEIPAAKSSKPPGYIPARVVKARDSMAAKGGR